MPAEHPPTRDPLVTQSDHRIIVHGFKSTGKGLAGNWILTVIPEPILLRKSGMISGSAMPAQRSGVIWR
jgi:hypothetical protein